MPRREVAEGAAGGDAADGEGGVGGEGRRHGQVQRQQRERLLLAGELEEVGPRAHDGGSARGHLEGDLGARVLPGEDVELLDLFLSCGGVGEVRGKRERERGGEKER